MSPHCQYVLTCVEIPIDDQATGDAAIHPIRQREILFAVATASAILRGMRGVHGDGAPVGPCRTLAPRGVMEALGEASVLNPLLDSLLDSLLDALLDPLLDSLRLLEARAQRSFPTRPCRRLLVLVHRLLSCFPGLRALGEQRVAEPASRLPRLREPPVLAVGGRAAGGGMTCAEIRQDALAPVL